MSQSDLLLIDDHALFRAGLRLLLARQPGVGRVHEAGSVAQALDGAPERQAVRLICLDIQLPGLDGLEGVAPLRQAYPQAAILVLSGHATPQRKAAARAHGVEGFLDKTSEIEEITRAVAAALPAATDVIAPELTAEQRAVLHLLAQGQSNKLIARELGLPEPRVRAEVAELQLLLGGSSRLEAAERAQDLGLLDASRLGGRAPSP